MEIKGTVEFDGTTTEFLLTDDGSYMQWGGNRWALGQRTGVLEALGTAYLEWREENLCRTCEEHLLDDGEGYDGECGDCADQREGQRQDEENDDD